MAYRSGKMLLNGEVMPSPPALRRVVRNPIDAHREDERRELETLRATNAYLTR